MRGDSSDNLKNIPGVGEKTAAKWIREFGSLEELVDRVDEVKGKVGDKLRDHLDQVLMNRRLTQLMPRRPAGASRSRRLTVGRVGPRRDQQAARHAAVPRRAARPAVQDARHGRGRGGGGLRGRGRHARPRRGGRVAARRCPRAARARLQGRVRQRHRPDRQHRDRRAGRRRRGAHGSAEPRSSTPPR